MDIMITTTCLKWVGKVPEVGCVLASTLVLAFWHGVASLSTKIACEIPAGCLYGGDDLLDSL